MHKNPYVVLGIPFGSSRDVAQAAFATKARRLRRQPDGASLLTELTWAHNQIHEALRHPEHALGLYRVPADPAALEPQDQGLLNPVPELLGQRYVLDQEAANEAHRGVCIEALGALAGELSDLVAIPAR